MEAAMKGQKRYLSCCYLRFCAYSATITYMNFRNRLPVFLHIKQETLLLT